MKLKKHLGFTALRRFVSSQVRTWTDSRRQKSADYSVHDALLSGFACLYFQEPSMREFQQRLQESYHKNNLRTQFGVRQIPKANALKAVLDAQDSRQFRPIFKGIVQRLQRGKQLAPFDSYQGLKICSIDGTEYHNSTAVCCQQCLSKHKDNPDKRARYQHAALQAAIMHPNSKQVIPVMAEPIGNTDGTKKQDCESNAAKRLIPALRGQHPKLGLIITGDDLFSRQPMIECVRENNYSFFFVAKPASHAYMMEWLAGYDQLHERREVDEKGRTFLYQWMNDVPLHGEKEAVHVNYFCKKRVEIKPDGKERVSRTQSWVTDLEVSSDNVVLFTRSAKCRWKIENECFNTLKNQGYYLEHNYGHGENHLAFNFYLLTLLAFLFHQVFELSDGAFQACRAKLGSKRAFWERLRVCIAMAIFESWEQLLDFVLNRDDYDIIDGCALLAARAQPP